jgi:hypothetical protein
MKKLFLCVAAAFCSTFAFADANLVVSNVTIPAGGTQIMEVSINKANTTAFQFDLKLPAGISVTNAVLSGTTPSTRKVEKTLYNESTNTYRFLTYDEGNAVLADGTKFNVTLAATADAKDGDAETSTIVIVDPNGNGSEEENGTATVTVGNDVTITVGSTGKTTYVGNVDLDFTGSEAAAFVVMGVENKSLWMARVTQVPAGTPIVVKAAEGNYTIKSTTISNTYYKNFLIGNNSDSPLSVTPEGTDRYYYLGSNGFTQFTATRNIGAHKAYIRAAALADAKVGSNWPLSIGDAGRTTLCADVDLDFDDQTDVKAYVIMGYDGNLWTAQVNHASAGTPLYIKGTKGDYTITSSAVQAAFANMLVGNNTDAAITIHPTDGEYTNYFLGKSGFTPFTADRQTGAHKSYLQVLTSYLTANSRGNSRNFVIDENEVEVVVEKLGSVSGEDDGTTGIRSIDEGQFTNDTWYNLNGQRIDTPTKKGLYIKNGKKVLVK